MAPLPIQMRSNATRDLDNGNYEPDLRLALQSCKRDCEAMRSLLLRTQRANARMAKGLTHCLKAFMNLDHEDEQSIQEQVDGIMDVVLGRTFLACGLAWTEAFDALERDTFLGMESLRRYAEQEKKSCGAFGAAEK